MQYGREGTIEEPVRLNVREESLEVLRQPVSVPPSRGVSKVVQAVGYNRFPLLGIVSMAMRVCGLAVVALGIVLFVVDVVPWIDCMTSKLGPLPRGDMEHLRVRQQSLFSYLRLHRSSSVLLLLG